MLLLSVPRLSRARAAEAARASCPSRIPLTQCLSKSRGSGAWPGALRCVGPSHLPGYPESLTLSRPFHTLGSAWAPPSHSFPPPSTSTSASTVTKRGVANAATGAASQRYRRLTQHQHILQRPDIYIGSIQLQSTPQWVVTEQDRMELREVKAAPGFLKIVDEILINAADNKTRDKSMSYLKVELDPQTGTISVENDGAGIPIEQHHDEQGLWIPELIFGNFLTSSNYDDMEAKITGGRNGYGAKLTNVYSDEFQVSLSSNGTLYTQTFKNNMQTTNPPSIKPTTKPTFTRITFRPDYARFGMTGLDADTLALLRRRVYDLSGSLGIKVILNGRALPVKDFQSYVRMYLHSPDAQGCGTQTPAAFESVLVNGKRWEVAVAPSLHGHFDQVSFVNNISTTSGGRHVEYVERRLVNALVNTSWGKGKNEAQLKAALRPNMWLFLNCQIVNPAFDSQTKESLTTAATNFGSSWSPSRSFLRDLLNSDVIARAQAQELERLRKQEQRKLRKTDGSKTSRIIGIPKLEDANNAGGPKSHECTLILTEGDSARALAVAGLTQVGRDNYGVFPLRGKLLNVRTESPEKVAKNAEISAIKEILGLKHGQEYRTTNSLRYGRIMLMTDQDLDGAHIKGLLLNYFATYYPSLMKIPNFVVQFITPIIRASQGNQKVDFFSLKEYAKWVAQNGNRGWKIKYYKGLGTSNSTDIKTYFRAMSKHVKSFVSQGKKWSDSLDLAFNRERSEDRKIWLEKFGGKRALDLTQPTVRVEDFVNTDLVQFSLASVKRSIPSVVDGLKPGQRKILFACFRRGLTTKDEVKVAQLGGYVAEHTAYHHGESNMNDTIIGLAQQFVGKNNLNLLVPIGQFGSRATGGQDAAASRYIYTTLNPATRAAFPEEDDALLMYLDEEGQSVEPEWYVPVLPMALVNGAEGIATAWSTSIPNYNPTDLINNLLRMLGGQAVLPMTPWYRGFRGLVHKLDSTRFQSTGVVRRVDGKKDAWEITELPLHKWTSSYKAWLDAQLQAAKPLIQDYQEYHSESHVHFVVQLTSAGADALARSPSPETFFKLIGMHSTNNMHLFDPQGCIKRYRSPEEIIRDFFEVRLKFYHLRKDHLIRRLEADVARLTAQAHFVELVSTGKLKVSSRPHDELLEEMTRLGLPANKPTYSEQREGTFSARSGRGFEYLLNMPLRSLTQDKVSQLAHQLDEKKAEKARLLAASPADMWKSDLHVLREHWDALLREEQKEA